MKKILVTGGCGYIGSHTIVDLINKGYEVVSVDNLTNSTIESLAGVQEITGVQVENHEVDLRHGQALEGIFMEQGPFYAVIHFAALKSVGESVDHPLRYFDNNVNGMINLLASSIRNNVQRFVFSSSCTVYGDPEKLPVTEQTPILPAQSPYGRTKQIAESIMEDTAPTTDMSLISLRYFNPAGAHESAKIGESSAQPPQNLVPIITEAAYGIRSELTVYGDDYETRDGSCIRDYIHVSDLAAAHSIAVAHEMDASTRKVEVFNLGTGEGTTVLEAIKAFESSTGKKVPFKVVGRRPGDVPAIYSNSKKAQDVLGWKPIHDMKSIMKSAWEWEVERRKK